MPGVPSATPELCPVSPVPPLSTFVAFQPLLLPGAFPSSRAGVCSRPWVLHWHPEPPGSRARAGSALWPVWWHHALLCALPEKAKNAPMATEPAWSRPPAALGESPLCHPQPVAPQGVLLGEQGTVWLCATSPARPVPLRSLSAAGDRQEGGRGAQGHPHHPPPLVGEAGWGWPCPHGDGASPSASPSASGSARSARRDHARGNEELAQLLPGLQVFGADERVGALTHRVSHGQELAFGSIRVRCLFTPCHTSGHMCYFMWEDDSPDAPALFSGDTLFVGGCGQFFEGTAEQMLTNLTQILGALPRDTKVFCGHECTVRNLKFALKVEPENEKVKEKLAWAKQRDDEDLPTVPSTLEEEFLYNPFLRVTEEAVQRFTGRTEPVEVLRALRSQRDNFKKPKERLNPQAVLAFDWGLFEPFLEKK
uniref:Hydroxyacylglutathione hydrolase-like protein n=1 Tax=Taeniopygia guttata TaxID=59729 RepID=A0A674HH06_TAEGU